MSTREFDMKHQKKAEERISLNVVIITIEIDTIVSILYVIKIIKLPLRNSDK